MKQILTLKTFKVLAFAAVVLGGAAQGIADPNVSLAQRRPAMHGGGGFAPPVQSVHARRDTVRTQNYVAPSLSGEYRSVAPTRQTTPSRRTGTRSSSSVSSQRSFTGTSQGRVYDNGLPLRRGVSTRGTWRSRYFRNGYSYFPYYYNGYASGYTLVNPYGFFYGLTIPYLSANAGQWYPPAVAFVDIPTYTGNSYAGFYHAKQANLINDPAIYTKEPGLDAALNEIVETYQGRNIDGLATLVDPNVSIAVYTSAHYQYSITANNLVDLTRDALQADRGIGFTLQALHQRSPSVFCASGENDYKDANGIVHSVYMSFVLQDVSGQWTLTQIGTAPDLLRKI